MVVSNKVRSTQPVSPSGCPLLHPLPFDIALALEPAASRRPPPATACLRPAARLVQLLWLWPYITTPALHTSIFTCHYHTNACNSTTLFANCLRLVRRSVTFSSLPGTDRNLILVSALAIPRPLLLGTTRPSCPAASYGAPGSTYHAFVVVLHIPLSVLCSSDRSALRTVKCDFQDSQHRTLVKLASLRRTSRSLFRPQTAAHGPPCLATTRNQAPTTSDRVGQ